MSTPVPRVSVVIPCYAQAHLLPGALESTLAQKGASVEAVVVDDGSPDDVRAVAARYPGVRYVHQQNQGLSAARNTGLRESTGDYVVFLDADDRLLPGAIAAGLACFAQHPESAFVYGDFRYMSEEGAPLNRRERPPLDVDLYGGMLVRNHVEMISTALFRRSVLDREGAFDTTLRSAEDYDLLLRIARRYPTSFHQELVAEYRRYQHRGRSLSQNSGMMLRSTVRVLRAQRRFARGNAFYESQLAEGTRFFQDYYGGELVGEVRALLREHRWLAALRGMVLLLRYYPRGIAERLVRRARTALRLAHG
ncbi:MAG TPA: glycosyltransferase [Gemmatimonadaceae bacterium]|nr:glycosyltransferase [Gemmatimonadaceae bacterium]